MNSENACDCRKILKALNNAIIHIDWLNCVAENARAVVQEYHLQWPPHRLKNAIEILEIALNNYDDFRSNNEKSDISIPEMPDMREPCKD
jgi:hypothetical protein